MRRRPPWLSPALRRASMRGEAARPCAAVAPMRHKLPPVAIVARGDAYAKIIHCLTSRKQETTPQGSRPEMIRAARGRAVAAPLRGGMMAYQIKIARWNADALAGVGLLLAYPSGRCRWSTARTQTTEATEATGKMRQPSSPPCLRMEGGGASLPPSLRSKQNIKPRKA